MFRSPWIWIKSSPSSVAVVTSISDADDSKEGSLDVWCSLSPCHTMQASLQRCCRARSAGPVSCPTPAVGGGYRCIHVMVGRLSTQHYGRGGLDLIIKSWSMQVIYGTIGKHYANSITLVISTFHLLSTTFFL